MDEIVLRAMRKWPQVPRVFGWLRLDRRGQWLVKARQDDGEPAFRRIGNPAMVEFIGRNYEADARGRWFFQNGPQRVFVGLDYTPVVYRMDDAGACLVTHTGAAAGRIARLLFDDAGGLLVLAEPGVGVVDDRDMAALLDRLARENPGLPDLDERLETALAGASCGLPPALTLQGCTAALERVRAAGAAARFGFEPQPAPDPGEPEC